MIDRSEINRALAKAIAYKQCAKDVKAAAWAAHLVRLLDVAHILDTELAGGAGGWRDEWSRMERDGEAPISSRAGGGRRNG